MTILIKLDLLACWCTFVYLVANLTYAENSCRKLKKLDYELYGTKTIYETARRYIAKAEDLPKSFDDDSLADEHKELEEKGCKPVVFYFVGRHSARFPDGDDIELYNKKLYALVDQLKQQSSMDKCPEKFAKYLNWTSKMQFKHDNLITERGALEERAIASRFKRIYPDFFDATKSEIKIGVTKKVRTAQTGVEFLKEVNGFKLDNCDSSGLPTNDLDKADYDLDKILQSSCYKSLMDKQALPFLEFHKQCEKISGDKKVKDPLVERLKEPRLLEGICRRVAAKLGLSETIDVELMDSMFDMCRFENAFRNESVWCSLFEKEDVQILEYIEDISTYIKSAYGPRANVRQSCPLIKDLVERFSEGTQLSDQGRRSYFYFSHAGPIKKLLAAFGVFQDEDSYTEARVNEFVSRLKVDKDREWRSSVVVPFSGNMAFVLYRCQKSADKQVKHKVLATVTEQPVKLAGCNKSTKCSLDKFLDYYEGAKECDLNKICARA